MSALDGHEMTLKQVLRVEAIIMDFVGLRALDHVSLVLKPREILGLIGPNGSGKTTTVNVITGFLKPSSGRIFVDGQEVTGLPSYRMARVGVRRTFQTIRLFKALSVFENVEVAGVSAGMKRRLARQAATDVLTRFDLMPWAKRPAGTLPYGQERRLEIARALVSQPKYLLLDEPAAGMNEEESDALLELLPQAVADYQCGMLIIDHDMRLMMRLCDRLQVLNYGRTIAEGTPTEIAHAPEVIKAYLGSEAP